jgi:hypothetical protein
MKAKQWVLSGFGCIAASILVSLALGLYWLGKVRSFASDHSSDGRADPTQEFGVVMVGDALAGLLFIGGLVVLIVGFIKLAKEPSGAAQKTRARQEPSVPSSEHTHGGSGAATGPTGT